MSLDDFIADVRGRGDGFGPARFEPDNSAARFRRR
jgi:hypothetical protein